jgi:myosin protein heavy chain
MVAALDLDETTFKIGTSKIFFKAGCLAELEEQRHMLLFQTFSRLQAAARMWTARRQMKKILNRAVAVKTIQRNARVYGDLREWPWWQLYTKVSFVLSITGHYRDTMFKGSTIACSNPERRGIATKGC